MNEPLAYRLRPKSLEDFVGQEHVLGKDKLLYRAIKADRLTSLILWGPPGCGKTSLAEVISNTTKYKYYKLNAVTAGISDIKAIVEETENYMLNPKGKSILFIDEIHRFNKKQQDVLLPYVEKGTIILIGATTENPYFEINKALISRSIIVKLEPLKREDIYKILNNALSKKEALGELNIIIDDKLLWKIADISNGDVRYALSGLEIAAISTPMNSKGEINIDEDIVKNSFQEKKQVFDRDGDMHYDNISAFIKSVRGSDADAAILYLAKALKGGEDPIFLARRLVILASEDIGLANPEALTQAVSCMHAVKLIGMPEARIPLAQTTIYLANSKKSNTAYLAINKALSDVETRDTGQVPLNIRNAVTTGLKNHNYGKGYLYPHDYEDGMVEQQYMPDIMKNTRYYIDRWGNDFNEIKHIEKDKYREQEKQKRSQKTQNNNKVTGDKYA